MKIDLDTPIIKARGVALDKISKIVAAFVEEYEWTDGDGGYYTPKRKDRLLIEDAIEGLLADDEFMKAWDAWRALCRDDVPRVERSPTVTAAMVDRFLSWPLPKDFAPDCHISFKLPDPALNPNPSWPVGTNLFTADQARAMLEHVLLPRETLGNCDACQGHGWLPDRMASPCPKCDGTGSVAESPPVGRVPRFEEWYDAAGDATFKGGLRSIREQYRVVWEAARGAEPKRRSNADVDSTWCFKCGYLVCACASPGRSP